MAIVKARPRVRLRLPSEIRPGERFEAQVLVQCKRAVEVEHIEVILEGIETFTVGSGKHATRRTQTIVRFGARLADARTLPAGETVLPVRFELPAGVPASYASTSARIEYTLRVHVSVPWWPDRRAEFEVLVLPAEVESPREDRARIFASNVGGPRGEEAHAELSLSSDWTRGGDVVQGAFALANVAHHRYSEARVAIVGTEVLHDGGRLRQSRERLRYEVRVGIEAAGEGEQIPFSFRLPSGASAGFLVASRPRAALLLSLSYALELTVEIRWGSDLVLRVPFEVLPRSARPSDAPSRLAPPTVGSDRVRALWTEVGGEHGLAYDQQTLSASFGETALTVRRDHLGRGGVHLVTELTYPELHLALEVTPASGLELLRDSDKKIGDKKWDAAHHLVARDEAQAAAFLARVVPLLSGSVLRHLDDRRLEVARRDGGESYVRLTAFVSGAVHLARTLEALRSDLPPPPRLAPALPAWRALARRLNAPLETARMRIVGQLASLEAEARVSFDREGQPQHTWLTVRSPTPLDDALALAWSRGQDPTSIEGRLRGEALELARTLMVPATSLAVETGGVVLSLDGLLGLDSTSIEGALTPDRVEQYILRAARLVELLRGQQGPYR